MIISQEQKQRARKADLYDFMIQRQPDRIIKEGNQLRFIDNKSICIKRGYSGFMDFATGEHGNTIDFLTNHLGYTFKDAITELTLATGYTPEIAPHKEPERDRTITEPEHNTNNNRVYAYLCKTRGIDRDIIKYLIDNNLLYETADYHNICFMSYARDCTEIHGTLTERPYKKIQRKSPSAFWGFIPPRATAPIEKAYITESAIDAISLYQILRDNSALFVSIAGAYNQAPIDRVKSRVRTVVCCDNDKAGRDAIKRNPDCSYVTPKNKDWNEDLLVTSSSLTIRNNKR